MEEGKNITVFRRANKLKMIQCPPTSERMGYSNNGLLYKQENKPTCIVGMNCYNIELRDNFRRITNYRN